MSVAPPEVDGPVPSVSVIIPTYNRAHCLPRALESVLRQTYSDIEVIVVDDCSKDATLDYLASIADPRLRVLRHEQNKGGAAARNTGINAARADIIAFQDSDDEWLVTKLARQIEELARHPADEYGAVYCGKVVYGRTDHDRGARRAAYVPAARYPTVSGEILSALLHNAMVSTQTLVARTALLQKVNGFDETLKLGQDWDLTIRMARHTKFAFVEEPLVMTFVMDDSISTKLGNSVNTWERILEKNLDVISANKKLHARNLAEIGRIYQRQGKWREAKGYLRQAISVDAGNRRAWAALALSMVRSPFQGRSSAA